MSKTVAPEVPIIIEGLATAELPEPTYLCSGLHVFVQVDRWHGTRKTAEYRNEQPIQLLASPSEAVPFLDSLQRVIAEMIEDAKKTPDPTRPSASQS